MREIHALDISPPALAVARRNAASHPSNRIGISRGRRILRLPPDCRDLHRRFSLVVSTLRTFRHPRSPRSSQRYATTIRRSPWTEVLTDWRLPPPRPGSRDGFAQGPVVGGIWGRPVPGSEELFKGAGWKTKPSRKTCPAGIGFSSSAFQRNSPTSGRQLLNPWTVSSSQLP